MTKVTMAPRRCDVLNVGDSWVRVIGEDGELVISWGRTPDVEPGFIAVPMSAAPYLAEMMLRADRESGE